MQLAIASHACAGLSLSPATAADAAAMQAMPDCDQADLAQPALCHAHCLDGSSSLDKPQTPSASPAAVIVAAILTPVEPLSASTSSGARPDISLSRITSPPVAIRHCCLRI
jgi:hypothetical protein